ncbi:hypothetical protein Glove_757g15 [Diversispora epigaea]|uniref:Ribosome biogenesis protein SLX9 n=1 Tax=Diversispora epigaea TaxID=1348612 RepID=A0A397FZK3_9GLOM|nr:hypothetical protein Glove_757g15 [Diversispora epigaea]
MPNKRNRRRKSDKSKHDEPPTFDNILDIPRQFTRIMHIKDKKEGTKKKNVPDMTPFNFDRQPQILKESSVTKNKTKIKRYREKIKQKKLEKNNKLYEELNVKDFGNFQDQVKFGEVVQAPPSITTIPKSRQNNAKKIKNFEKILFIQNST